MKAGPRSMLLVTTVVLSAITACTVRTSDGRPDAGGTAPDRHAAAGEDEGGTASDASGDASTSVLTTPRELAGTSWTWTTSSGAHQLTFTADGGYASDVFLDGHPGEGCGTEYFTHREGVATFEGTKMTLAATTSMRTKKDSCSGNVLAEDAIEDDMTTYGWRLDGDDAGVQSLVLTSDDGSERSFLRD